MGFSQRYSEENTKLLTLDDYDNHCKILMGGRTAEYLKYDGKISQGSYDDLQKINNIQRTILVKICLDGPIDMVQHEENKDISESGKFIIETKLKENICEINRDTGSILTMNWLKLIKMSEELIEKETLYREDIVRIMDET